ncbi:MAG: hypothetical protein RL318_2291 [Fibrobacterota bacterium]|jgi:hypothetical protein
MDLFLTLLQMELLVKRLTLSMIIAGALAMSATAAHAEGEKNNVFGVNPLGLIFNIYTGDYARFIQDGKAEIDIPFTYWQPIDELTMMSIGAKYRMHIKGQPEGPFVGGGVGVGYVSWDYKYIDFNSANWDTKTETITGITVTPVAELGYRWIWGSGFTMAPSVEAGFGIGKVESENGAVPTTTADGFQWGLNLGLGWNF